MAALDFPANPSVNQKYTGDNGVTYVWTGTYWAAPGGGEDVYVRVDGDNMTGALTIGETKFRATPDGNVDVGLALTVGTTSTVGRLRVSGDETSNPLILAQDAQGNSQQVFSGKDVIGNETSAILANGRADFGSTSLNDRAVVGINASSSGASVTGKNWSNSGFVWQGYNNSIDNILPTSSIKTTGDATFAGDVTAASLNQGPLAGYRNFVDNGRFFINQYGLSTYNAGTKPGAPFIIDRWRAINGSTSYALGGDPVASVGSNFITVTPSPGDPSGLIQGIELYQTGNSAPFMVGQTYTLSFYSQSTPKATVAFADNTENLNAVVIAGEDELVAVADAGGGITRYAMTFKLEVAPQNTNKCVTVMIHSDTNPQWNVMGVQLEQGPVATPLEVLPPQVELAECQRYYEVFTSRRYGNALFAKGTFAANNGYCMVMVPFQVSKRSITSTVTFTDVKIRQSNDPNSSGSDIGLSIVGDPEATTSGVTLYCSLSTGFGQGTNGDWSAYISDGTITIDAEL